MTKTIGNAVLSVADMYCLIRALGVGAIYLRGACPLRMRCWRHSAGKLSHHEKKIWETDPYSRHKCGETQLVRLDRRSISSFPCNEYCISTVASAFEGKRVPSQNKNNVNT